LHCYYYTTEWIGDDGTETHSNTNNEYGVKMAYCTQADLERRIGIPHLAELTNDVWGVDPPANVAANLAAGGALTEQEFYVVTALQSKGETILSSEANETPSSNDASIVLSWGTVSTATSYRVYRSNETANYSSKSLLIETPDANYTDDGSVTLTDGTPPTSAFIADSSVISAIIEKADREIDSKAGQVWTVPFTVPTNCTAIPSLIKQISIDMSIYYCFMRRFSETEVPKQWQDLYAKALQKLDDVSNMLVALDGNPTVLSQEAYMAPPTTVPIIDFYDSDNPLSLF
jgi:phage gp36-like protein